MTAWPQVPLGEALTQHTAYICAPEPREYAKLSVKLYGKGVVLDVPADGTALLMKRHQLAKAGQVILSEIWGKKGAIGIVPPAGEGALCTSHFFLFDIDEKKLLPGYLQALFTANYLEPQLGEEAKGTTGYAAVRPKTLLAATIPLPSLPEQRRIVARIEELAGRTDEARSSSIDARVATSAVTDAFRAEVFELLSKNGTVPLDQVAVLERGKFSHRPRNEPRFFGGPHPWIQIGEIEASDKYIRSWTETLNDAGLAISKKFRKGTLLISIAATIGAVGILDFDCCVPDSIVGVTPKRESDGEFIYHFLLYARAHLERVAPQSAQKNINLKILSTLPVPHASPEEQRRIVAKLDALQAKVDELKRLQAETQAELDALLPSILDRAFKGEL